MTTFLLIIYNRELIKNNRFIRRIHKEPFLPLAPTVLYVSHGWYSMCPRSIKR